MAAFFWLNVLSFDLWYNFRGTSQSGLHVRENYRRFALYSLYAWGWPLAFLAFTWYAQEIAEIPLYLKPEIGNGYCWLSRNWSSLIYFFGPMLLINIANIVMFTMTAMKIHHIQKEMSQFIAHEDSAKNLRNEKDQ